MPGVAKVPAKRAPEIGEHNDEVLKELGFDAKGIEKFGAQKCLKLYGHCRHNSMDAFRMKIAAVSLKVRR